MLKTNWFRSLVGLGIIMVFGCGQSPAPSATVSTVASIAGTQYLLAAEPQAAKSILQVREESKQGDEVTLMGRIGGDVNPWVEGRAAFSLVDLSAKACSDIAGDSCPTPWDYCCETDKLVKGKTLIKLVGDDGKPVATDARELLGVKELDTLVVQGKAQRDESGNLTILASKVFVRPAGAAATAATEHDHDHSHDHDHQDEEKTKSEAEPVTTTPPATTTESAPKN